MNTTTALTQWNPDDGSQLPAYLSSALDEFGTNIPERATVPSLSYKGRNWSVVIDGNETKLEKTNDDGDREPISIMRLVVLDFNGFRGRAFYTGTYNPAQTAAPTCWSGDGEKPDPSVKEPQNSVCNGCPQSIKGSKVVDGREMVACSAHRLIVVAPGFDLAHAPLRLKIAVTSDYDKEVVEHGWFAFRQYTDYLKSRGVTHTGLVITKVKFDPNVEYPKLLFSLDRPLTPEEVGQVRQSLANPQVKELLSEKWTAAGSAGTLSDESDIRPSGLEAAYLDGWQAHPDSAQHSYKDQEVLTNDELAARYPATPDEPRPAPEIPAAQQVIDQTPAPKPTPEIPSEAPKSGLEAARADGWQVHPDNSTYYFKGQEVLSADDVAARYPPQSAPSAGDAEPASPPSAPPASPPSAPAVEHDPRAAALADGWVQHPDSEPHGYKGTEVREWGEIDALYPETGASAPAAPATPTPAAATGQTEAPPSEGDPVTAELDSMLDKWTG